MKTIMSVTDRGTARCRVVMKRTPNPVTASQITYKPPKGQILVADHQQNLKLLIETCKYGIGPRYGMARW